MSEWMQERSDSGDLPPPTCVHGSSIKPNHLERIHTYTHTCTIWLAIWLVIWLAIRILGRAGLPPLFKDATFPLLRNLFNPPISLPSLSSTRVKRMFSRIFGILLPSIDRSIYQLWQSIDSVYSLQWSIDRPSDLSMLFDRIDSRIMRSTITGTWRWCPIDDMLTSVASDLRIIRWLADRDSGEGQQEGPCHTCKSLSKACNRSL
jgi:hypothetical protein